MNFVEFSSPGHFLYFYVLLLVNIGIAAMLMFALVKAIGLWLGRISGKRES